MLLRMARCTLRLTSKVFARPGAAWFGTAPIDGEPSAVQPFPSGSCAVQVATMASKAVAAREAQAQVAT